MTTELLVNVTCVAIGGRGVLIEGAPGSGKSSLALALIDRGAMLVGDDGIRIEHRGDRLWASPPPNIGGYLEIRGVGIVEVPCTEAPLCLVLAVDSPGVERLPAPDMRVLDGFELPRLALRTGDGAALRAEWALRLHGLPAHQVVGALDAGTSRTAGSPRRSFMPSESPTPEARVLFVTGMSGAGKSTALQVLEDLGWETIDNAPLRLLGNLSAIAPSPATPLAMGIDSRTRGYDPAAILALIDALLAQRVNAGILFLDATSAEIERRYNETRRPHPLARGRPVSDGIKAERELLEPLRARAEVVVDTSGYAVNQLQQVIRNQFADEAAGKMLLTVISFGFARGMPPLADLVFDMRFLDNPHWDPVLRSLTGLDAAVGEHIENDPAFEPAMARIIGLVLELLPHYAAQGRAYLTIAFGCTGGRHRSVYSAEQLAEALRDAGHDPSVVHRNLGLNAATVPPEGSAALGS